MTPLERYEAERIAQRPDDRALWALARPYTGCSPQQPCPEHVADGAIPIPYGPYLIGHPDLPHQVERDEVLVPS